ncbi:hypothetical protein AHMF7605_17505 [Adhaeribacter arboris]|uniref:Macroglobulin domain-containing protein n=1 Tax=Adhaeribacter arboris TaxID=2072846 RepID=A0A2T2YI47_9BACT|nr:MG2 domain-containing protein [Adhaeribacter arboris]PSR55175.1 hypothetical protein AHMF7605_17505 [Adhaeribacter arboris]
MNTLFLSVNPPIPFFYVRQNTLLGLFLGVALLLPRLVFAQPDSLKSITSHFDHYRRQVLTEKLFLHLDRPAYVSGETMWYKVYSTDGIYNKPLALSKIAYVEVVDKNQKPVLQAKTALQNGFGNGSFSLPFSLNSGNYTVRAYTNWMKNAGPDYYFSAAISIINTFKKSGIKPKVSTPSYDIQFFPEGGNLVQNLPSKVACKVMDSNGKGVSFRGELRDQNEKVLTSFQSLKFGMGHFYVTPTRSQKLTAVIIVPNSKVIRHSLPTALEQGYVMHLQANENDSGNLKITVQASSKTSSDAPESIYLLAHTRNQIAAAESKMLQQGQATFLVNKKDLAAGISHFTIFNRKKEPVCERLYFKRPTNKLNIVAHTNKTQYLTREPVILDILTQDEASQATSANVSVAVYQLDSLSTHLLPGIQSYLWLRSDLRGEIENPDYYFENTDSLADDAADNLMLTQGWRRFKWEAILTNQPILTDYPPELNGHFIMGKVTDTRTGKSASNISTYLASPGRQVELYTATSNTNGSLLFEVENFYNSQDLVLQTNPQRDSTYHLELLSPFSQKYPPHLLPDLHLLKRWQTNIATRHLQMQAQNSYFKDFQPLVKLPVTDSIPFYGNANEKYKLDDYTRFKTMEEVMREYVIGVQVRKRRNGFHFMVLDKVNGGIFQNNPMVLLDGVPIFNINKIMAFDPRQIQKLEVLTSRYFHGRVTYEGLVSYITYKGNLGGFTLDPRALLTAYQGLQIPQEFYSPQYNNPESLKSRLPDLRNLLYWSPDSNTSISGKHKTSFYTSDQPGKYVIVLQGITKDGLAGSASFTFEVKNTL